MAPDVPEQQLLEQIPHWMFTFTGSGTDLLVRTVALVTSHPATNFLYGSLGAEREAGISYWIVVVLPRIFDDLLPGPGGYASLGLPWKEGAELPAGFSKKTVGFPRVGFNCALCHATQ